MVPCPADLASRPGLASAVVRLTHQPPGRPWSDSFSVLSTSLNSDLEFRLWQNTTGRLLGPWCVPCLSLPRVSWTQTPLAVPRAVSGGPCLLLSPTILLRLRPHVASCPGPLPSLQVGPRCVLSPGVRALSAEGHSIASRCFLFCFYCWEGSSGPYYSLTGEGRPSPLTLPTALGCPRGLTAPAGL